MRAGETSAGIRPEDRAPRARRDAARAAPTLLNVQVAERARLRRTRVLRAAGYRILDATSAADAIRLSTLRTFDLALIDLALPDANGIDLCDTLKRLMPDLEVLLVSTAAPSPAVEASALAAGALACLKEPLASDCLVRQIGDLLGDGGLSNIESDAWVLTDPTGLVLDASPLGGRLLGATARGLYRRNLLVFFDEDRAAWQEAMPRAAAGERIVRPARLRPKERRPMPVQVGLERVDESAPLILLWSFQIDTT
jgi:CheY-like chemotaxis protein